MNTDIEVQLPVPVQVILTADDGYPLSARLFKCENKARAKLIVAGATGVPQTFYQAFAMYAASQGYETLTLDYRGIGNSKPATLNGFEMAYLDWAYQDLAAAVEYMHSDAEPLYMIGHSFAGMPLGSYPIIKKLPSFIPLPQALGGMAGCPSLSRSRCSSSGT